MNDHNTTCGASCMPDDPYYRDACACWCHDHDTAAHREAQPHWPTQAELAAQRQDFALDGATDRPYHYLARAHVDRGNPWNMSLATEETLLKRTSRHTPPGMGPRDERARMERLYVAELPFLRTRTAGDGERWAQALGHGRQASHVRRIRTNDRATAAKLAASIFPSLHPEPACSCRWASPAELYGMGLITDQELMAGAQAQQVHRAPCPVVRQVVAR